MIGARLQRLAERNGYSVHYKPIIRRRGWPDRSKKPFMLCFVDGTHIASFTSEAALERNLRARTGD